MSTSIHIAHGKINTVVNITPLLTASKKYYRTKDGRTLTHIRSLVFDSAKNIDKLKKQENISSLLKDEDPEIDLENTGKTISSTTRLIADSNYDPVHTYRSFDVIVRPSGEVEERSHLVAEPNVSEAIPVRITEKSYSYEELVTSYVFRKSYLLTHSDGISYAFLYEIAEQLAKSGKLVQLQAYDQDTKKPAPLILYAGGRPFPRIFLEGRIDGDKYCLIMHLSDRELKLPERFDEK